MRTSERRFSRTWLLSPLAVLLLAGCGHDDDDTEGDVGETTLASTVSATVPAAGETDVAPNRKITATFNRAMNAATITTATFTLTDAGGAPVAGTVAYDAANRIAAFTPSADLASAAQHTARLTTGITDSAGNPLPSDVTWNFTTGSALDATAPSVSSTDPADMEANVAVNKQVTATFAEPMDSLTITGTTFTLTGPGSAPVSGTVTYSGNTATFTPSAALASDTAYTARITTGARDLAGIPLASPHVWSFSTGAVVDSTPPTVLSTVPGSGATGVPLNQMIAVAFSEAMDPSTVTTATFAVTDASLNPVVGTVTYDATNHIATFRPTSDLSASMLYAAEITTGATDLAGNALAAAHGWTFTTGTSADTTPPTVTGTDPFNIELNVPHDQVITATFSEPLDSSTITASQFVVTLPGGIPVAGTVTYSGTTATFTPSSPLQPNTEHTCTIGVEVTDLQGNPMTADYVWVFATAP